MVQLDRFRRFISHHYADSRFDNMKNLFCIIILLFSLSAIADDLPDGVTISDFVSCGWLLVELNALTELEEFSKKSIQYEITDDQLFDQLPVEVKIMSEVGMYEYALRAQEACGRILSAG